MIYYAFDPLRPKEDKELIKLLYPTATIIDKEPFDDYFLELDINDTLIIYDICDLCEIKTFNAEYYLRLINKGIILEFEKTPECNSKIIRFLQINDIKNYLQAMISSYKERLTHDRSLKQSRLIIAGNKGKQIGSPVGIKHITKKSIEMKQRIKQMSKDFDGSMNDVEIMKELGIARNTYYRYKKEI